MKAAIRDIVTAASEVFGISRRDIMAATRRAPIVHARKAVYLAAELEGHPYAQIGRVMGRDHSTVISGCKSARWYLERDPGYAAAVERIRELGRVPFRAQRIVLPALLQEAVARAAANDDLDDIDAADIKSAADAVAANSKFLAALGVTA